jgi:hypothetical protein
MSSRPNPFVHSAPKEFNGVSHVSGVSDVSDVSPIIDEFSCVYVLERGPESPDLVNALAPSSGEWPTSSVPHDVRLAVFGLHGGAGTSTVAQLFDGNAFDAGQGWPLKEDGSEMAAIAVSRTHYAGLEAAESFTQHWGSGSLRGSRLLGLILIDDAPRLIDSQQRAVKRLLKKTPLGAHVPWVESWRYGPPDPQRLPLRIKRIVRAFQNA